MVKSAWYDVEMRGRRLEAIFKDMNTRYWNNIEKNPDLAFAFFDRMAKIESTLQPYIEQITGIKQFIKKGNKIAPDISA